MRVDLFFEKIQFSGQFFVLKFFLLRLELEPVLGETQHTHEDHDEQRRGSQLHNVNVAVEVVFLVTVSIHQPALQVHTNDSDDNERDREFEQVLPQLPPFEEPGK